MAGKVFNILIFLVLFCVGPQKAIGASQHKRFYTSARLLKLREQVRDMFQHAYDGYLRVSDYDELRPLTCDGVDTWGSYSLTLIDALDTLATMGNYSEFRRVAQLLEKKINFDKDINVSVFETNIRVVGGLISAHLLSRRAGLVPDGWPCQGPLLRMAEDVAQRLLPAFDTNTGMPYGTVNLRNGVPKGETAVTCTAGVGTFLIEFGTLSRLTGNPIYEEVAMNAVYALWERRSPKGLFGNHIDVQTGRWTAVDAGIGAGVDSFFEYLVKGAMLLNRPELLDMFHEARDAIDKYLKRDDWYVWANMNKATVTLPVFQSLEAFWPGILSMVGDNDAALRTLVRYSSVWRKYGFLPEFYNIANGEASVNRESYPLRPELAESLMYLYRATNNQLMLELGELMVESIEFSAKTKCGYATIRNVVTHEKENRMESFFLAETTKYLYLLFDEANFLHNDGAHGVRWRTEHGECAVDAGAYIFNTEAHPVDMSALHCCHGLLDDPYEGLDLDAFHDDVLLQAEQKKRDLSDELQQQTHCNANAKARQPPTAANASQKPKHSDITVDIDVFDDDDNPAAEILVENFQRIRNERAHTGDATSGIHDAERNQLTVTDLDEFFTMRREHFASDASQILSYVEGFMRNFTLDAAFISGLHVLDKNLTSVLGAVIQREFEGRMRTLWELYVLQAQYVINAELVSQLGLLAFNEDNTELLQLTSDALAQIENATAAVEQAESPLYEIMQKLHAARHKFEMSLVNTTCMQEFLLKILQNGTQEKKRAYIVLLQDTEISALHRRSARKNIFANLRRILDLKRRMIETFDRLQALMDETNKLTGSAFGNATTTTTLNILNKQHESMDRLSTTINATEGSHTPENATPPPTTATAPTKKEEEPVEHESVWSQLVHTILRKTNMHSSNKFDQQLLMQKTQASLQKHIAQRAPSTLSAYEHFTCTSPRFVERFAYRDFHP